MSAPRAPEPDILAILRDEGWIPRPPYTLPTTGGRWGIQVVGSPDSAGLADFVSTAQTEPGLQVVSFPCAISDPQSVWNALVSARRHMATALVVVRGGGDGLGVFDDPRVVRTLALWPTYTVLGVGHATDHVLAGQVVDHEAITPTAAAQWLIDARRRADSLPSRAQPTGWRWPRWRPG